MKYNLILLYNIKQIVVFLRITSNDTVLVAAFNAAAQIKPFADTFADHVTYYQW